MARRGKTVIKGGPDSGKMMQAAESGERARGAAEQRYQAGQRHGQQQTLQTAKMMGDIGRDIQGREDREEALELAQKQRGEDIAREDKWRQEQMDFRREQEQSRAAMKQRELDIEAADKGLQVDKSQAPQSPFLTDRQQALQSEMEQGAQETGAAQQDPYGPPEAPMQGPPTADDMRRAQQEGRELGDSPYIQKSPERMRSEGVKAGQEQMKLETARLNAKARLANASVAYKKAYFSKDKEAMQAQRKVLQVPVANYTDALNAVMNNEEIPTAARNYLMQETVGHPVHEDVKSYINTGSLEDKSGIIAHLRNMTDISTFQFIQNSHGDLPDPEYLRFSSPKMQQFIQNVAAANYMGKSTGLGGYGGVKTSNDKERIVNIIGAQNTMNGVTLPGAMPQPGPAQPTREMRAGPKGVPPGGPKGSGVRPGQRGLTPDERRAVDARAAAGGPTRPESELGAEPGAGGPSLPPDRWRNPRR